MELEKYHIELSITDSEEQTPHVPSSFAISSSKSPDVSS